MIPTPLWIVLFLSAGIIFVFMLFFADSAERAIVQATMMGSVAVVITSTLLLLSFLNNPYHPGLSGIRPVAMERTLDQLTQEKGIAGEASISRATRRERRGRAESGRPRSHLG